MPDLLRLQRDCTAQIKRWGQNAFLVRAGAKRQAWMAMSQYTPTNRGNFLDGSVRILIDGTIALAPDFEQDVINFKIGRTMMVYKILLPPAGPQPSGIVIAYDCNCMSAGPA